VGRDLKLRIKLCATAALGPGKVGLLEAVERCGSITAAARDQGMSYRRAWGLLEELNHALAQPVVVSSFGGARGGGATVTETGRIVIALYRRMESKAQAAIAGEVAELAELLAPEPQDQEEPCSP